MAVQANELRIGNWVKYTHSSPFEIHSGTLSEIEHEQGGDIIDPIPLTPEILEKAGFVLLHHNGLKQPTLRVDGGLEIFFNFHDSPICVIVITEDNYDENINLASFTSSRIVAVLYIHQLQNLYFCLTGKELEINL